MKFDFDELSAWAAVVASSLAIYADLGHGFVAFPLELWIGYKLYVSKN